MDSIRGRGWGGTEEEREREEGERERGREKRERRENKGAEREREELRLLEILTRAGGAEETCWFTAELLHVDWFREETRTKPAQV